MLVFQSLNIESVLGHANVPFPAGLEIYNFLVKCTCLVDAAAEASEEIAVPPTIELVVLKIS